MTGPEHWSEADLILSGDPCEYGCPHTGCPHEMRMIARTQVHALLALTEAYVAGATMRPEDRDEWDRVTERLEPGELAEPGTGRAAMRRFMREHPLSPRDYVQRSAGCAETSDGAHAGDWHDVPDPEESQP